MDETMDSIKDLLAKMKEYIDEINNKQYVTCCQLYENRLSLLDNEELEQEYKKAMEVK